LIDHLHLRGRVVDLPARRDRKLEAQFRVIEDIAFDIALARIFTEDDAIDLLEILITIDRESGL